MIKPRTAMNGAGESAASAVLSVPRLRCKGCKTDVEPVLSWNERHIEARCPTCKRHMQFVKQIEPWVSLVPPRIIQMSLFEGVA